MFWSAPDQCASSVTTGNSSPPNHQEIHSKLCKGRIFGCHCSGPPNNLARGNLNSDFSSKHIEEAAENKINEEKQKNIVSFVIRDDRKCVQNIHNCLIKGDTIEKNKFEPSENIKSDKKKTSVQLMKTTLCRRRTVLLACLVFLLLLTVSSLPFIVDKARQDQTDQFYPLRSLYHRVFTADQIRPPTTSPTQNTARSSSLTSPQLATLRQLFLSVKSSHRLHYPRLVIVLETWASLARDQVWVFTDKDREDEEDQELVNRAGPGHLVTTDCDSSHHRLSLCCKMEQEFSTFLASHKQWWCHFDDDNYVNLRPLLNLLERYDSYQPWYLGKTSTASPLKIIDSQGKTNSSFWFATGGAGFCISRTLALKIAPLAVDGRFIEAGNKFWFPDDVTLGYLIEHELGHHLTVVPEFHSHLERMSSLEESELHDQISFSYLLEEGKDNVVNIPGPFPPSVDPTRFYSLHCWLYEAAFCPG